MTTHEISQSQKSDTPRTDAAIIEFEFAEVWLGGEIGGSQKEIIEPDFARALERENARLRQALEMAESWGESGIETMNAEARAEYERLKS